MHHAAAHDFQPTGATADTATLTRALYALDIYLCRRLCKGEIGRPEANRQPILLEERMQEVLNNALQLTEADILIDQQSLHLMKHRRVG